MSLLETNPNPDQILQGTDFTAQGDLRRPEDIVALVKNSAELAESFIASKQWNLYFRDCDLLYQAPRPLETYGSSYVLAPNVQRFTVAKVCNSVVPQLYKGLFFQDPPMVLRPRPGTSQKIVDEKTALMSFLLDECQFKREVRWGLEYLALFGTGIWKWGIERVRREVKRRTSTEVNVGAQGLDEKISVDEEPKITVTEKIYNKPFIEFRPL